MSYNATLAVEALKALAWPVFAAIALIVLRRPLIELVAQLVRRATKVSVFDVSIELVALPELQPSWSAEGADVRSLTSSMIFDSPSRALFEELLKPVQAEYAIIDLKSGQAWLTSRLYIFAVILGEVRGLRAFVFLETTPSTRRKFVGVATPANVRRALGRQYPWFEESFARAWSSLYGLKPTGASASSFSNLASPLAGTQLHLTQGLVRQFIDNLQRPTNPPAPENRSYLEISGPPKVWERASWIDAEILERDLEGVLECAWVNGAPDAPRQLLSESVARRNASFVALLESDRRFIGLVDRTALLAQMATASPLRAPSPSAT